MTDEKKRNVKIKISNLVKNFGGDYVLNGFSLSLKKSESLCLIGTSGSGKSVALKCLIGLLSPDSGSITVDDQETVGQSRPQQEAMLKRFGMTFQFGALFDSLPIWENVTFRLRQKEKLNKNGKSIIFHGFLKNDSVINKPRLKEYVFLILVNSFLSLASSKEIDSLPIKMFPPSIHSILKSLLQENQSLLDCLYELLQLYRIFLSLSQMNVRR